MNKTTPSSYEYTHYKATDNSMIYSSGLYRDRWILWVFEKEIDKVKIGNVVMDINCIKYFDTPELALKYLNGLTRLAKNLRQK